MCANADELRRRRFRAEEESPRLLVDARREHGRGHRVGWRCLRMLIRSGFVLATELASFHAAAVVDGRHPVYHHLGCGIYIRRRGYELRLAPMLSDRRPKCLTTSTIWSPGGGRDRRATSFGILSDGRRATTASLLAVADPTGGGSAAHLRDRDRMHRSETFHDVLPRAPPQLT